MNSKWYDTRFYYTKNKGFMVNNVIREILNSLGINKEDLELLNLKTEELMTISELKDLVFQELIRKNLGLTPECYNIIRTIRFYKERFDTWINISNKFITAIPEIPFYCDIQQLGFTDTTILKLEENFTSSEDLKDFISLIENQNISNYQLLEDRLQNILLLGMYTINSSEQWIFKLYEFLRTLKQYINKSLKTPKNERDTFPKPFEELNIVFALVANIRIPLAKYELRRKSEYYCPQIAFPSGLGIGWKVEDTVYTRKTIADLFLKIGNSLNLNYSTNELT